MGKSELISAKDVRFLYTISDGDKERLISRINDIVKERSMNGERSALIPPCDNVRQLEWLLVELLRHGYKVNIENTRFGW